MSGSGMERELTRNQKTEMMETRVLALTEEVVRHRSSLANIEMFLEAWPVKVNDTQAKAAIAIDKAAIAIAWMQLPWWRRMQVTIQRWWWGRQARRGVS